MKHKKYLERARINTALSSIFDYPLTILEAPMGYGKTTAVKMFLESNPAIVTWVSFTDLNQSESMLWDTFSDKIGTIDAKTGMILKSLGFPSSAQQTEKILQLITSISLDASFLLIIDNYQNAHSIQLSKFLMRIAQEEIDNFHILIMTRDTSSLDFIELLSRGLCYLVTKNILKFTKEELYDYCRLCDDRIAQEDYERIYSYTDGWISFAYIILIGLVNKIPIGISTPIEELIDKALFSSYSPELQTFLLKLSIMENFSIEQAELVTGDSAARHYIKKLSKENTFIQQDQTSDTYVIHHVLLDFLRMKQFFTQEEIATLYSRLSDWYFKKNEYQIAYGYLYQIGRTEQILAHLNQPSNIQNEQFTFPGVHDMFNHTPRELILKYPIAYLVYMLYSIVTGMENEILSWEKRLDELEQHYQILEGIDENYRNRILAEVLIVRRFTYFNDIAKMKSYNREIIRLLNGQTSYITSQEHEFTFGSPHHLYIYYRDCGSFQSIANILSENIGYAEFSGGCGTGSDALAAAEYALETGDFDKVEPILKEARKKSQTMSQTAVLISIDFCQIRLRIVQGRLSEALELLHQMKQNYGVQNNSLFNTTIDLCKGYVYASIGQSELIPAWLQIGDMTEANFMYQGIAYNYLVYGKALMASEKFIELEALIVPFKQYFSIFSNQLGHIHNKIFDAVVKYRLRGSKIGVACLEAVIMEAEQDQLVMPFVESSPYVLEMLQIIQQTKPDHAYVKQLITLCKKYNQIIRGLPQKNVEMTQREISILTFAASGLKRKDIADRLFISEETVKSHYKNIYQKLEVNSKLSAIKIAESRGYLVEVDPSLQL